ncbi:MAG: orotidine-5'-phosphate decarboxylase [Legionellaceae bacterium]|nr:orotidine-5'-phosphate decarboxylase [Legionellaceae bacterium]
MGMEWIVALDGVEEVTALAWADAWDPSLCALKVGHESFTRFGPSFVRALVVKEFKIFLDLKFHDIPNTVASACKAAADLGVWMLNVHASGGAHMMQVARKALESYGETRPLLIAVTVLTSLSSDDLTAVGIHQPLLQHVVSLAELAKQADLDGVVCSAHEVSKIKAACGQDFLTVTPGIRMEGDAMHDQVRCVTPAMAEAFGSDFGVIGRSITKANDPLAQLRSLILP